MCDYSLHNVRSRRAKISDKLVSTKFSNSITRGLTAVGEPDVVVCLLPGTEVVFQKEVEYQQGLNWFRNRKIEGKVARFRQVNMDQPNVHHDALEFPNGQVVLVSQLCEGQHLTVLQLPPAPSAESEVEKQKHVGVLI
jgi:hypothetical protein